MNRPSQIGAQEGLRGETLARQRSGSWLLDHYFYFFMSLLIAAVVIFGFSQTIDKKLLHPTPPRPIVLYVHAIVFFGWVFLFMLQSALVRTRMIRWHRRIGWFGVGLGAAVVGVGVCTAVAMARFNSANLLARYPEANLLVSFFDIAAFTVPFVLSIVWRADAEKHRRLQLMACCALTSAAFGRFPPPFVAFGTLYLGVDFLILLAAGRDLLVSRRIHPVYLFGLPSFAFCQAFVLYTVKHHSAWFIRAARFVIG